MFNQKTLRNERSEGMVIAIPWHRKGCGSDRKSDFETSACNLWGGDISWRTATSYDAARVISTVLSNAGSTVDRKEVRRMISARNAYFEGATGTIKFHMSGDRVRNNDIGVLVQVKRNDELFDFVGI
jgi:branched-chain amino acid transport system substrate-binding protein